MKYATPELVVVGSASALVQGVPGSSLDNAGSGSTQPALGIALGLDD
jgi:hypothetical protein